jgi:23S rRNA (cytidine1920-2'-O)/16S rRNA (cytidine1409-2'-O)-methyltransferase
MKKTRLDLLLLERGLFDNREVAQAAIMDGGISIDGKKVTKPGMPVSLDANVTLASSWGKPRFVSRGGLKLEKALLEFKLNPNERICLDIGASTGGFTDCLLQQGARCVYAVDVGYGQLDWSLRNNPKVVVRERVNARHLTAETLYEFGSPRATLAVMDVSFISLLKVVPAVVGLLSADSFEIVALIKPQFEAGREAVGKGGVVRSPEIHVQVITRLLQKAGELDLRASGLTFSPLKGPAGNIEYLVYWKAATGKDFTNGQAATGTISVEETVATAFQALNSSSSPEAD